MKDNLDTGLDEVLKQLGPFGRFTVVNYALILIPCFLTGMYAYAYNFEALDIQYRCEIPECETLNHTLWLSDAIPTEKGDLSKCKAYQSNNNTEDTCTTDAFDKTRIIECESYIYGNEDSVVKDFNLGCQYWKRTLIGTIHNAGFFVSLPVTGIISDRYGRKVALAIVTLINGIFGIARSFSTSYTMMLVFEFLEGSFGAGHYATAFVMAMELVVPKGRVFGNTMINWFYVFGQMTLAGLAWKLQNWRYLLRVIFTPGLFLFSYLIILTESPRWLISQGRVEEATQILRKAAKMNKVEISEDMFNPKNFTKDSPEKANKNNINEDVVTEEGLKTSVFKQVIKSSIIRTRLAICSYMWMTCTFVYYGLSINSVSLAGNKYLNFMLVAAVELPASLTCFLMLDRFGRKKVIIVNYILSGCLCITLSVLPKDAVWWSFSFYLIGKYCITVTYNSLYVYVSEVFPTSVRQSLLGFCSTMGRFGSTLAPLTPLLALQYDNLPAIFFGILALVASVLVFRLPETNNVRLPDTIKEAEDISKKKSDNFAAW